MTKTRAETIGVGHDAHHTVAILGVRYRHLDHHAFDRLDDHDETRDRTVLHVEVLERDVMRGEERVALETGPEQALRVHGDIDATERTQVLGGEDALDTLERLVERQTALPPIRVRSHDRYKDRVLQRLCGARLHAPDERLLENTIINDAWDGMRMADPLFVEFTAILLIATIVSVIARVLRQPQVIGYIVTGVIVSPFVFGAVKSHEMIGFLSEIGVALLLFIVGIHLSPREARQVGGKAVIAGFVQVVLTAAAGTGIAVLLGLGLVPALYLGLGLSFSSTIIVLKLLTDRGETDTLHGRISIGVLLTQDLIAVIALLVVSSLTSGEALRVALGWVLVKIGLIIAGMLVFTSYVLPFIDKLLAKSHEILFIFSISWMFALGALFSALGFSIEVGALIAGVTLSISAHRHEISSRMKPLRDFFIILFFILIGTYIDLSLVVQNAWTILALSAFVLVGTPIVVIGTLLALGYARRVAFMTGIALAQVSEFCLILVTAGIDAGQASASLLATATTIMLVTIAGSTYLLASADRVYGVISPILARFERADAAGGSRKRRRKTDVIVFGFHRVGFAVVEQLKRRKMRYLVADYDPAIIAQLERLKHPSAFGDVGDPEFLASLDFASAKMIISTVPDQEDNMLVLNRARRENPDLITIVTAYQIDDAEELYQAGATYVLMPHFLGGEASANLIERNGFDLSKFLKTRERHISHLRERRALGHDHPESTRNGKGEAR